MLHILKREVINTKLKQRELVCFGIALYATKSHDTLTAHAQNFKFHLLIFHDNQGSLMDRGVPGTTFWT